MISWVGMGWNGSRVGNGWYNIKLQDPILYHTRIDNNRVFEIVKLTFETL